MIIQELGRVADRIAREFSELTEAAQELDAISDRFRDLEDLGMWDVLEFHRAEGGGTESLAEAQAEIELLEGRCFPDRTSHDDDANPHRP